MAVKGSHAAIARPSTRWCVTAWPPLYLTDPVRRNSSARSRSSKLQAAVPLTPASLPTSIYTAMTATPSCQASGSTRPKGSRRKLRGSGGGSRGQSRRGHERSHLLAVQLRPAARELDRGPAARHACARIEGGLADRRRL